MITLLTVQLNLRWVFISSIHLLSVSIVESCPVETQTIADIHSFIHPHIISKGPYHYSDSWCPQPALIE